jgi:hypothetical protein
MKSLTSLFLLLSIIPKAQTIDLSRPPAMPSLLSEGVISTGQSERDFALSPDGNEIFYTLQAPQPGGFQTIIYRAKNAAGKWSEPQVASFAGTYSDLEPAFSPDGQKLFFSSNRPVEGKSGKDFDIWVVEKKEGKWGTPYNIGAPVNTDADEYYPSITSSGNLYFTAQYKYGVGKEDIFLAIPDGKTYKKPVPLDTAVNSSTYEFNAFVSPDEKFIIFTSYGRKDDKGRGDLYMSTKDANGKWLPARNLAILNSDRIDYCPFVSFDKKIFFWTSEKYSLHSSFDKPVTYDELIKSYAAPQNGKGDIYWIHFDKLFPDSW